MFVVPFHQSAAHLKYCSYRIGYKKGGQEDKKGGLVSPGGEPTAIGMGLLSHQSCVL